MKITLKADGLKKVATLLQVRNLNIEMAAKFSYYLNQIPRFIHNKDIQKMRTSLSLDDEKAFITLIDKKLKISDISPSYLKGIHCLNPAEYQNNSYYQHIKVQSLHAHTWEMKYVPYYAYQGFVSDDVSVEEDNYFLETTHIGYFKEDFYYLSVDEKGHNWMSITPNEINTMQEAIDTVSGKVITFGLGLGYFAYMAARKSEVQSVTIIEKDAHIIALFKEHILPQFPDKDKITIIEMDAFEYIETKMSNQNYDVAFVDLWHEASDGLPLYLKTKKLEALHPHTTFLYWLEKSFLSLIRRCVLVVIEEQLQGASDLNFQIVQNDDDRLINQLYYLLKDYTIAQYSDIVALLKDASLRVIATKL